MKKDCFGEKYSSLLKCVNCERQDACAEKWSARTWQTQRRRGGFVSVEGNTDGGWDNIISAIEDA